MLGSSRGCACAASQVIFEVAVKGLSVRYERNRCHTDIDKQGRAHKGDSGGCWHVAYVCVLLQHQFHWQQRIFLFWTSLKVATNQCLVAICSTHVLSALVAHNLWLLFSFPSFLQRWPYNFTRREHSCQNKLVWSKCFLCLLSLLSLLSAAFVTKF